MLLARLGSYIRNRIEPETYPGIRLRISVASGVVVDANSEHLYYSAKYGGPVEPCGPACPPDCDKHGWLDLIAGGDAGTTDFSTVPLKIAIKPVRLAEVPE